MRASKPRGSLTLILAAAAAAWACGTDGDGGERSPDSAAGEDARPAAQPPAPSDSAGKWMHRLHSALGGEDAWERTRYLQFRWLVSRGGEVVSNRFHAWDRYTGRYRLEYERDDGDPVLVLVDIGEARADSLSPAGEAWIGGEKVEETARRDSLVRSAYRAFINDSYWLVHPYKWDDPGVHRSWEGWTELSDGKRYPTVRLSFDADVGVTTDRYWSFVDPDTGLLHGWQFHLEGRDEKGPVIRWDDWTRVGDIMLARSRVWPDGATRIRFEELAASAAVPEGTFDPTTDGPGSE